MLWLRGLIFTAVVPFVIGHMVPRWIGGADIIDWRWMPAGWLLLAIGTAIYFLCFFRFLRAGGTPAIFFTKPLRFLIGREPSRLVVDGLYRYSRNPMYLGVVAMIFGWSLLIHSRDVAVYGVLAALVFHLVVVILEEPHLRRKRGPGYDDYRRQVPRWIGIRTPWGR